MMHLPPPCFFFFFPFTYLFFWVQHSDCANAILACHDCHEKAVLEGFASLPSRCRVLCSDELSKKRKKAKSFECETSQTAKISESIMVMWCTPSFLSLFKCLVSESVMQTTCQFFSISSFAQHQFGLTSEETFPRHCPVELV